jgi:hypothetical protein
MLNSSEKAYCQALESLARKQYREALRYFDAAAPDFANNEEFGLLHQTTRVLCSVKAELAALEVETTKTT